MARKLTKEHLEQIAGYLVERFPSLKHRRKRADSSHEMEIKIRERIVRVEEELKNQREILRDMMTGMEKRFEQVDKRFEEMRSDMEKRFGMMMWFTGLGLTFVTTFITGMMVFLK